MTYRGRRSPREERKSVAPGRGAQLEMGQHLVGERGGVAMSFYLSYPMHPSPKRKHWPEGCARGEAPAEFGISGEEPATRVFLSCA